jgi:sugar lactone lactonase YvrE
MELYLALATFGPRRYAQRMGLPLQPMTLRVGVMDSARPGSSVSHPVQVLSGGQRAWRGLKRLLIVSAIGVCIVPLPLLHACGLVVALVVGPIAGVFAARAHAVLGVHCGKFPAEGVRDNVLRALQRHGVTHPVVHDPVHAIWEAYAVRSWPTVVVVDPTGRIALQQPGELGRQELGDLVEALLAEGREAGTLATPVPLPRVPRDDGRALRFPGKVHVWPDALAQELDADPWSGAVYVADTGHHRIVEYGLGRGPDGWPVLTPSRVFGTGAPGMDDGVAGTFREPQGLRRHEGTLYVADTGNHALRAVNLATGAIRTLAGTGRKGTRAPTREQLAQPRTVDLRSPWDVEVMPHRGAPLVFVAMAGQHQLWVYAAGHVGILAGSGREDHVDGPAAAGALAQPSGLALLGRYLLFADAETSSIRALDLQSHQLLTIVGRGLFDFGDADGPAGKARLQHPLGVTLLGDEVLVADTFNHKLRAIGLTDGTTRTVAGGAGVFAEPGGVARAGDFALVADTNHHRLCAVHLDTGERSEERRVGKECRRLCRSRWSPYH